MPSGLTFDAATATISGIPTVVSSQTHRFTISDATLPTNQTAFKDLLLTIGAAAPTLSITTNSLPNGTTTLPYSANLGASGGTPPYKWSTIGNIAPAPGLTLSQGGAISGTPGTTNGSPFTRTYRVEDSAIPPQVKTKDLTITVGLPAAPTITTTILPDAIFDVPYNQTINVSNGTPPFVWGVISGTLPAGLTITSPTISFTPDCCTTGIFTFTVRVTDNTGQFDDQPLTLKIVAPPPPTITTSLLPIGTVNVAYSKQLAATGGVPPLTWQPVGMPFGLTFTAATATISGSPTSNGTQNVTFTVNDSTAPFNQTGTRTLSLTVNAAVTIDTISPMPAGTVGQPYAPVQLVASGGAPPYTWSITGTGAPSTAAPGLTLSLDGVIGGSGQTPTIADSFTRTYRVEDDNGVAVTKSLTLNVNAALTIDDTSLPAGQVNVAYGPVPLTASGGTPPYIWSTTVTPPLPAGLSIDAAGTISGTPTVDETNIDHTFTVTDSASTPANVNKALSLTIAP